MTIRLSDNEWHIVVQALDHTITVIDKLDPKLLGADMEDKDKYRFMYVLQKLHNQL
jgi:hypothetical protein